MQTKRYNVHETYNMSIRGSVGDIPFNCDFLLGSKKSEANQDDQGQNKHSPSSLAQSRRKIFHTRIVLPFLLLQLQQQRIPGVNIFIYLRREVDKASYPKTNISSSEKRLYYRSAKGRADSIK
ncbi:hypothetical protein H5410_055158 [Solanum commersonii]|uniref:Uncharacterized protein n=1 Tax=Solanum commersonii TaxID=4109 RepID=A0A9J5WJ44_SOLCO|nr:hypothetical protein H5410_055158 [Solanum commersonii]